MLCAYMHFVIIRTVKERINWNQEKNLSPEKEGILSHNKYKPVDLVSVDQFVVNKPGRLPTGYVRESSSSRFHGGTL